MRHQVPFAALLSEEEDLSPYQLVILADGVTIDD